MLGERVVVYARRDLMRASQSEFVERYAGPHDGGVFSGIAVRLRHYKRVGVFVRLRKQGLSPEEALKQSDSLVPLTPADRKYEEQRRKHAR